MPTTDQRNGYVPTQKNVTVQEVLQRQRELEALLAEGVPETQRILEEMLEQAEKALRY